MARASKSAACSAGLPDRAWPRRVTPVESLSRDNVLPHAYTSSNTGTYFVSFAVGNYLHKNQTIDFKGLLKVGTASAISMA